VPEESVGMKYVRLYADPAGDSHFEDVDLPLTAVDFAPPAPPAYLSSYIPATRCAFIMGPAGWYGDWHPTPRRQFFIWLSGETEVQTSDGAVRRFGPGSVVLVEDTTGKGHVSRVVSTEEARHVIVQLPD
jgi:hypothetical protein